MKNQVLNCMSFANPDNPGMNPIEFSEKVLASKYGWQKARLFFGGVGDLDWKRIEENLKNREYVPEGCPIIFDLEREDCTIHFPDYEKIDKPMPGAMGMRELILETAQSLRPDCPSTFYSYTTPDFWIRYQTPQGLEQMYSLMRFSAPVLRRQSFVNPQFYFTKSYPIKFSIRWIREEIRMIRRCQPFADIVPMYSPVWYEKMNDNWQPDYPWTQEYVDQIAIPGNVQRIFLDTFRAEGVTKLAGYVAGWMPWPMASEMMKPILEWTK